MEEFIIISIVVVVLGFIRFLQVITGNVDEEIENDINELTKNIF